MSADANAPQPVPRSETPPPARKWLTPVNLGFLVILLYAAILLGKAQIGSPGLVERDGYFHARFAQMLPEFGLSRNFEWTEYSTWKDRFCDKEFLFHVFLVPFARDAAEPLNGVRWGIWILSLAIFVTLFAILRASKARWPLLFVLLLLCADHPFLGRIIMIRSHVMSISLLLMGVYFLSTKNWKAVFVLGFVYAWSYTVPFVLLMTAAPFVVGRWAAGGSLDWKSAIAAGAGAVTGLIIHPYSPHTLESMLTYVDVITSGAKGLSDAVELGNEIYPYHTGDFFLAMPLLAFLITVLGPAGWWHNRRGFVLALFVALLWIGMMAGNDPMNTKQFLKEKWYINLALLASCASGWRGGKRISPEALGAVWAALFWITMTMAFSRFMEYATPLAAFALALVFRDVTQGVDFKRDIFLPLGARAYALAGTAALGLAALFCFTSYTFGVAAYNLPGNNFAKAAQWLEQHTKPGEVVVNFWWDDFPELYYHTRHCHFLVGLDPTYMQRFAPEKLHLLEYMRRRGQPLDGPLLAKTFNARYMIVRGAAAVSYPEMYLHYWKALYIDDYAAIFALTGPDAYSPQPATEKPDGHAAGAPTP